MGDRALCVEDINKILEDLDILNNWNEKWQMSFHVEKCKAVYINGKFPVANAKYEINTSEKTLGDLLKKI